MTSQTSTISADLIRRCATALSPERGQTALAEALGVQDRTVRRWIAGKTHPPVGIAAQLADALDRRSAAMLADAAEVGALAQRLRGFEKKSRDPEKTS